MAIFDIESYAADLKACARSASFFKDNYVMQYKTYPEDGTRIHEPSARATERHTARYNPTSAEGAPINGASVNLPSFPEHHIAAVISRANVARTPENKRIAAYAVGMSLDLLMQYLREQNPENDDVVQEFRYMLQHFAEWAGFEDFDAFDTKV